MKILFLVSSMQAGGAERVAATLSRGWVERGYSVTLVPTYTRKGELFYELDPRVRLMWLADRLGGTGAQGMLGPLRKLVILRRLVKEVQPDVIVSFLTNVNVMALMATIGMKVPVVVCERTNPGASSSAGPALQRLRRWLYPRADMVTVQAQESVPAMRERVPGIRRLAIVPNPLPPGLPAAVSPRSAQRPSARLRLVAMGRLVPSKRFVELVVLFARLAPRFPDWELYIWGDGPLRDALNEAVAQAGLEDRVKIPGRTSDPWSALQDADLFVLTSEVEGFPNALLEAMALGLPCITVDCPSGPRDISRDGQDAVLVPLYDDDALEAALARLMSDADARQYLGAVGAAGVRERYGLEQVVDHWDTLFAQVLRPHTGA